eukprot:gene11492-15391_t
MRKSSREVKQVELFSFSDSNPKPRRKTSSQGSSEIADSDNENVNKSLISKPKQLNTISDSDEVESEDHHRVSVAIVKGSKRKADRKDSNEAEENIFFDSIKRSKKYSNEIDLWCSKLKKSRVSAIAELVNFILMASTAGTKRNWIAHNIDLDPLEPDEIAELLTEMYNDIIENASSNSYLIAEIKRKGGKFIKNPIREKYASFWEQLFNKLKVLHENVSTAQTQLNGIEIIRCIIQRFIQFSNQQLVSIRDGVCEAALTFSKLILSHCSYLKDQINTTQRQIDALLTNSNDNNDKKNSAVKQSAKYNACLKQKSLFVKELSDYYEEANNIFNSIFVHRMKDTHEEIRALCTNHINDWILFDMNRPYKIENAKYLGWMCSDHSNAVRLNAVRSLIDLLQNDGIILSLIIFAERFMDRFVQIAVGDVDHEIARTMIIAMRHMQRKGLLDNISEEILDQVDVIVFDADSEMLSRVQALGFVMEHTEGFDNILAADTNNDLIKLNNNNRTNKKNKKKAINVNDQLNEDEFEMKKRSILQLETLTEFIEHHVPTDRYSSSYLLVEAALATPQFECCDYVGNIKALKNLIKVILEIINSSHNEVILSGLITSLCSWVALGGDVANQIKTIINELLSSSWNNIIESVQIIQQINKEDSDGTNIIVNKTNQTKKKSNKNNVTKKTSQ